MKAKKTTLLLIDDIEDYLRSLQIALKREFDVITARSLAEAKEQMTNYKADIILADIRLDEADQINRDGLVFLEWVKANYPEIPVIMMSAYREFDLAVDALNLGADKFLKKPINLIELKTLLRTLLR